MVSPSLARIGPASRLIIIHVGDRSLQLEGWLLLDGVFPRIT